MAPVQISMLEGEKSREFCRQADLSIWKYVDAELSHTQSKTLRLLSKDDAGRPLAALLHYAEYPLKLQYKHLKFFAEVVAPSLGRFCGTTEAAETGNAMWSSFMTDDGTPIELSWDWGTDNDPPTIRYSVEPIGLNAGTLLDPFNQFESALFHERLVQTLPELRFEWFDYFKQCFEIQTTEQDSFNDGHISRIFYAFDLKAEVTGKAYFFPAPTARRIGIPCIEEISRAIHSAPQCTVENLQAFSSYYEFVSEPENQNLEHDMLAIDMLHPRQSRIKIYFRSRETSFSSVARIMTLGGRLGSGRTIHAIGELKCLWNALLDVDDHLDLSLPLVNHRTAGILYNAELKLGTSFPVIKIYIPVRHYASSDDGILQGLASFLRSRHTAKYMSNYMNFMQTMSPGRTLQQLSGSQTYVGCSITEHGSLRLVSYIKPQRSPSV